MAFSRSSRRSFVSSRLFLLNRRAIFIGAGKPVGYARVPAGLTAGFPGHLLASPTLRFTTIDVKPKIWRIPTNCARKGGTHNP